MPITAHSGLRLEAGRDRATEDASIPDDTIWIRNDLWLHAADMAVSDHASLKLRGALDLTYAESVRRDSCDCCNLLEDHLTWMLRQRHFGSGFSYLAFALRAVERARDHRRAAFSYLDIGFTPSWMRLL